MFYAEGLDDAFKKLVLHFANLIEGEDSSLGEPGTHISLNEIEDLPPDYGDPVAAYRIDVFEEPELDYEP